MSYTNMVGRRFYMPELPMEPTDCWGEPQPDDCDEEYDRGEDELNGIFNRH